jgi:hypothetical protein
MRKRGRRPDHRSNKTKVIDVLAPPVLVQIDREVFKKTAHEKEELRLTKSMFHLEQRQLNSNYTKRGYKWTLIAKS